MAHFIDLHIQAARFDSISSGGLCGMKPHLGSARDAESWDTALLTLLTEFASVQNPASLS